MSARAPRRPILRRAVVLSQETLPAPTGRPSGATMRTMSSFSKTPSTRLTPTGSRLTALGDVTGCAGLAPVELRLDVGFADGQARRTAVHHATDGRAMGLAEGSDAKKRAERITGHGELAKTGWEENLARRRHRSGGGNSRQLTGRTRQAGRRPDARRHADARRAHPQASRPA